MQRSDSKDHYMQLKLGDVLRIEIKNHDVLLPKTLGDSFMVTHYNWLSNFGGQKSLKKLLLKNFFVNGLVPVSPDINFYNCFSETAVKIIMLNLSWEKIPEKFLLLFIVCVHAIQLFLNFTCDFLIALNSDNISEIRGKPTVLEGSNL